MKVLFVTHAYPRWAGDAAGSFLHRLATALRAAGAQVTVLAPSAPELKAEEVLDGIPIHRFRYAPEGMESLAYTGTMAEQVLGSLRGKAALAGMMAAGGLSVSRLVDRVRPDVIHAHWWFPAGVLCLAERETPLVTTMHGSDVRLARRVRLVHPLLRTVLERSASVTAVSAWLAGEARAMAPEAEIDVAPMPADTGLFRDHPGDTRVPGRFLFVGRLNRQKGLADLLDALAWTPKGTTLEVVGDGDDAAALRARAADRGVADRVLWRGQVPREAIAECYRRAQAVVMPSRDEGLGLVAVEAQLCRTPVIAYRSGGLPEVVDPAWGGLLVPTGDTEALAEAMRDRLATASLVEGQGASARARMLDRFSPGVVAAGYLTRYRSVLGG